MTTALLLLPVAAVLVWIYRQALPRGSRWTRFDSGLLAALAILCAGWVAWSGATRFEHAGPVFDELVAAAGAYPIILLGLGAGLAWRHARARRNEGSGS
ncbi:MAG: hypothetical protein R3233_01965 [Xanthomonadales bacterium]|nr:hypothetical protein [Xanthomonadales bacterium]